MGHRFPTNAALDATSTLKVSFTGFDSGERFIFGVDTDPFAAIDAGGSRGADVVGAGARGTFDDGSAPMSTDISGDGNALGSEVGVRAAAPEPGRLARSGTAIASLGRYR